MIGWIYWKINVGFKSSWFSGALEGILKGVSNSQMYIDGVS